MRLLFICSGLAAACTGCSDSAGPLRPPTQARELVVLTRASPTTFFQLPDGQYGGLEYDLAQAFGRHIGLPVRFVVADSFPDLRNALLQHRGHMIAAGTFREISAPDGLIYGPAYHVAQPILVYNTERVAPRDWTDIGGSTVAVMHDVNGVRWLDSLRRSHPALTTEAVATANPDVLFEKVSQGEVSYAIADSNALALAKNIYLDVEQAFELGPRRPLAWLFPAGAPELQQEARVFFARIRQDGTLQQLLDRYYGHVDRIEAIDAEKFQQRLRSTLPRLRALFQKAQDFAGVEWRLLAAVAYAESQWDPLATSPTNVRGLMMLTEETALRMKVTDRLDPRQSALAGALYLQEIKRQLPATVGEPDRTWFALATYNLGIAHLDDARGLALKRKLNPDSWADMKKVLPLLAKPDVAEKLRYGYARGGAAVIFVESIRAYYDILLRMQMPHQPKLYVASQPYAVYPRVPGVARTGVVAVEALAAVR
jgi:membrane-bound lytic murein transglycosylase F